jgi:hypothetical protein
MISSMTDQTTVTSRPRVALLRQRSIRTAWACVAVGLLIPFVALWGLRVGWSWRRADGGGQLALIACSLGVFAVRMTLWLTGTT